jgi:ribosomal protein S18 acetylase RimI-like enzyme
VIRDYDPSRHRSQLRACIVELQDFERGLDARREGASTLRVGVLAKNEAAARLYRGIGFSDYTIQLSKPLR